MSRMTSSACSAVAAQDEQLGGHPAGEGDVGRRRRLGLGPSSVAERSQVLCWRAGSADATQVSLLVPSPRLEMMGESGRAPDPGQPSGQDAEPVARARCCRPGLVGHREGAQNRRSGLEGPRRSPSARWKAR